MQGATNWRPIETHKFPWEPNRLLIAAKHEDGSSEVFLCTCADGGFYYQDGSTIALDEMGWKPFAWNPDLPPGVE